MQYDLVDERFEVWNGKNVVMEPSGPEHEWLSSGVNGTIHSYVRAGKLGKVFGSNTAVYLHGDRTCRDFVMPDLSYVSSDRLDIVVPFKGIYGAPDLAVEIVSPGKRNAERDLVAKFQLYERYGVKEYWIIHPYDQRIDIYGLLDGKYERIEQSSVLPGIEIDEDELFDSDML